MGDKVMADSIEVMGVVLNCLTAKEAMLQAMQFMESDLVDTIEILSMKDLMNGREDTEWKNLVNECGLVIPGEAEILKAADADGRKLEKETADHTFLKLFLKYLQKNQKKIFLLADTEEDLAHAADAVRRYSRGIRLTGSGVIKPDDNREESVINEINGTETDCILSVLGSPYQEQFIGRNSALLNTKVWLGCGAVFRDDYGAGRPAGRLKHFFRKFLFSWCAGKEQ